MKACFIALVLACAALPARAQQALEVIELRHATADQVLPVLRPLVEPGGALSAHGGQLIVRASPGNIAELRRALEAIDRPRRRLQILVRFDDERRLEREDIEARGRISNRGSRVEIRGGAAEAQSAERVDQRIQVLEGGRAVIAMGATRPVVQRQRIRTPAGVIAQETVVVQEASSGVEVTPRLSGDTVILDVAQRREVFAGQTGAGYATTEGQRLGTSVSGRLGEWIELGALASSERQAERGIGAYGNRQAEGARRIWVKVEEALR